MTFQQALKDSEQFKTRHALLGNGFSIACRPNIFLYGKLYEKADFSELSPYVKKAFEALSTQDFERVIKALRDTKEIIRVYRGTDTTLIEQLQKDADGLRELLVQTIAACHPAWPGEIFEHEYTACREFIGNFKTVYTLNYDLLLYWAQMHTQDGEDPNSDDGFRKPEDDFEATYVTWEPWNSKTQTMWFLHGALHLFDAGSETQKYTWINTGVRLIDQIREALNKDYYPIFVSEGTSREKYAKIKHNDYLAKGYRSFCEIGGCLFIYGHSLAANDEHFLKRIENGKLKKIYVSIFGDPNSTQNKEIIERANRMATARKYGGLEVAFYAAESAKVWG
ncbi:DUF4917 family protein [Rheinheimera sp.]|uniref:DUF4917 family protein n=1 Tax=Rheinheimera sp. TaxID=1869214 RepID=UPI00307E8175